MDRITKLAKIIRITRMIKMQMKLILKTIKP